MFTCGAGHTSESGDYCDTCGMPIDGGTSQPSAETLDVPDERPEQAAKRCENCGASLEDRFCESCGHDSAIPVRTPAPPEVGAPEQTSPEQAESLGSESQQSPPEHTRPEPMADSWFVVAFADREWYEAMRRRNGPDTDSVEFPAYCPQRRFTLDGSRITIGRRSRSRGTDPDIDLSGPPLDPGVSAQHATLLLRDDGSWEIVDHNSTNGTTVGDAPDPITPGVATPLADGDSIRLGAWTTLRLTTSRES